MKLRVEFNTQAPDEGGNVFTEQVIDEIAASAKDTPVFLEYDRSPLGFVTGAHRFGSEIELDVKLDEAREETSFFERGFIIYTVSCSYRNMSFEQTGGIRRINSARLGSVTIEPGRKEPPRGCTIFVIE